jgi:ubiquinol-cytochrome c reductase iron-sulfur subunit
LTGSAVVIGGIGAGFAAVPFVAAFQPSARARALGAAVEVDISHLESGQRLIAVWRGKPVWVVRRTPAMVDPLRTSTAPLRDPGSAESEQPSYAKNPLRSIKPEYLVLVGICTHLGCSPQFLPDPGGAEQGTDWPGGFFCSCHGSKFDLAGRVYQGVPAPTNLPVPPHRYLSDTRLVIGEDQEKKS